MKLSDIKPKAHSKKEKQRVGRGNGSGKGRLILHMDAKVKRTVLAE